MDGALALTPANALESSNAAAHLALGWHSQHDSGLEAARVFEERESQGESAPASQETHSKHHSRRKQQAKQDNWQLKSVKTTSEAQNWRFDARQGHPEAGVTCSDPDTWCHCNSGMSECSTHPHNGITHLDKAADDCECRFDGAECFEVEAVTIPETPTCISRSNTTTSHQSPTTNFSCLSATAFTAALSFTSGMLYRNNRRLSVVTVLLFNFSLPLVLTMQSIGRRMQRCCVLWV
jgi:hypothetical protein